MRHPHPHHHAGRGRHHRGPDEHRGGGRRRLFDGGELRLVLLKLIEEQPRHGYDLIREIEARSGGAYAPSPGVVYPTTTLLLDMGLAEEARGDGPRKLFSITDAGRAHLAEKAGEVDAALARLEALAALRERTDAAPIRRAMQNLKAALQNRLSQEDADKEAIFAVAALLDEAAGKIERM